MVANKYALLLLGMVLLANSQDDSIDCELLLDFNSQCAGWFQLGYCEEVSFYYRQALKLCPSSCSGCGYKFLAKDDCAILTDNFRKCGLWKLYGHCSYLDKHYGYMKEQCAYTCAGCSPDLYGEDAECAQLQDYNVDCVKWTKEGLCQGESEIARFMRDQCSYSCNGCLKGICSVAQDVTSYCADYLRRGWCNPRSYYHRHIIGDCEATCNDCV